MIGRWISRSCPAQRRITRQWCGSQEARNGPGSVVVRRVPPTRHGDHLGAAIVWTHPWARQTWLSHWRNRRTSPQSSPSPLSLLPHRLYLYPLLLRVEISKRVLLMQARARALSIPLHPHVIKRDGFTSRDRPLAGKLLNAYVVMIFFLNIRS